MLRSLFFRSERGGFEPPVPCGTTVFETAPFNHSGISPVFFRDPVGTSVYQNRMPLCIKKSFLLDRAPCLVYDHQLNEDSMVSIDLKGQTAIITGGTKGIGLASALKLAQAGVQTVLSYKWGSADMDELKKQFSAIGAPEPMLVQADVSVDEDTDALLEEVANIASSVEIFISNVGYAATMRNLDAYKKRSLYKTFDYSTWPMIEYTRKIRKRFGDYPKKVIGISSDGPDHFYPGYDYVAASKSLLEFFGRYMAAHLFEEGTRVNVIRFGNVQTESFNAIFGEDFFDFLEKEGLVNREDILTPEECGKAVFALCSGLMDAMNGQVINIDYGLPFKDNTMLRFLSWKEKQGKNV